jgi:hypothetical protein
MAYYPKNRIQTDLYTNGGEYSIKSTGENYTGYYYKLYNNTIFTGKTPNDSPNQELTLYSETIEDNPLLVIVEPFSDPEVNNYNLLTEKPSPKIVPLPYYPVPTENDYKLGEFQRYFMKQINNLSFTEISKIDYNALVNRNETYLWPLYTPISIPWEISGNKDQIQQTNKRITLLTEQQSKVYGFSKFIEKTGGYNKFAI